LLKKKVAADDAANAISNIIVEESSRLNEIITDFLNYARPRDPDLAPCRIDDIIEKNISYLSTELQERGFTIDARIGDENVEISADANMMYQAFLNIIINAMQAMPDGGVISVGVHGNDHIVTISFDDNGGGIPETILDKIWDPFFTTKEKGTGLGLGIVKNIVAAHGGRVSMTNRPEGGARVLVNMPRKQGDHGNHTDRR
jgi:signal transduction histidine kinase